MSRNLCMTSCYFCGGEVLPEETPRPITREEARGYYDTRGGYGHAGMIVANASCKDCEAKYLAWFDQSACAGYGAYDRLNSIHRDKDGHFFDMSFRSTFNDEPGPDDMPKWKITRGVVKKEPWV